MQGVLAPAGTPKAIIAKLNEAIKKTMAMGDVKKRCAQLGFDPVANTPEQFATYIKTDVEKWAR
jgi:tripartite-type tricarboxylate transporter receptor subunit TctC